jgi:hypothetical protein
MKETEAGKRRWGKTKRMMTMMTLWDRGIPREE